VVLTELDLANTSHRVSIRSDSREALERPKL
jgi:hypothetical protein